MDLPPPCPGGIFTWEAKQPFLITSCSPNDHSFCKGPRLFVSGGLASHATAGKENENVVRGGARGSSHGQYFLKPRGHGSFPPLSLSLSIYVYIYISTPYIYMYSSKEYYKQTYTYIYIYIYTCITVCPPLIWPRHP